jgi:hypothetical protein
MLIKAVFITLSLFTLFPSLGFSEQSKNGVQLIDEELQPGEVHLYDLPDLRKGDVLKVRVKASSGNLDPIVGLTKADEDIQLFEQYYRVNLPKSLEKGKDFAVLFPSYADNYFLAWNDDSPHSSDSQLNYEIEQDGDYQLVVIGSYYHLVSQGKYYNTFGKYQLQVGLGSDKKYTEKYGSGEKVIIQKSFEFHKRVQEITEEIEGESKIIKYNLSNIDRNEKLYLFVETLSGNLRPSIKLRNYGDKLLAFDNLEGQNNYAYLEYETHVEANDYYVVINGDPQGGENTRGRFKLLIGTNSPDVKKGKAKVEGRPIIKTPIDVEIAIMIEQISELNQKNENFTVVGNLKLSWVDNRFAYNPDTCKCNEKNHDSKQFENYLNDAGLNWPKFIFLNQQGRRHVQEDFIKIFPDGEVIYIERFTVTLQAPDFNFSKFPFDPQEFYVRIIALEPIQHYLFSINEEQTEIGDSLGEEEWFVTDYDYNISSYKARNTFTQFNLRISAHRHTEYYLFRIFIPLLLIVIVSWFIFFMRDFARRVDISVTALLVFVAFNFTLGSDLPRLGYLTFMDNVIMIAFAVTCLGVVCNVLLRRLEVKGDRELAEYLDQYITWGYPILVVLGLLAAYSVYF